MRASSLILAVALLGCGGGPVDLVIDVRSDLVPDVEVDAMTVALIGDETISRDLSAADDLFAGVRAAAFRGVRRGERDVTVTLRSHGAEVARRRVLLDVRKTAGVTVVITRDCAGVVCPRPDGDPALTSCLGGRCVDPSCLDETTDACPEPACRLDADCPAGAPCASATCVAGACLYGDRGTCGATEYCAALEGCRPRPGTPDVDGGADAGADAGEPPDAGGADAGGVDGGPGDDCGDGRLGPTEEGVDCGGSCGPCPAWTLTVPADGPTVTGAAPGPDDGVIVSSRNDVVPFEATFTHVDADGSATRDTLTHPDGVIGVGAGPSPGGERIVAARSPDGLAGAALGVDATRPFASAVGIAPAAAVPLQDGDVVLVGATSAPSRAGAARVSADATVVWARTYGGGAALEALNDVARLPDGDLVAVGTSLGPDLAGLVVRIDGASGDREWSILLGEAGRSFNARAVAADGDGAVVLLGAGTSRVAVVRLDGAGAVRSGRLFETAGTSTPLDVAVSPRGAAFALIDFDRAPPREEVWQLAADATLTQRLQNLEGSESWDALVVTERHGVSVVGRAGPGLLRVSRLRPDLTDATACGAIGAALPTFTSSVFAGARAISMTVGDAVAESALPPDASSDGPRAGTLESCR